MSVYEDLVSWSETSTFYVHYDSLPTEIWLKLNVRAKEQQFWKITSKRLHLQKLSLTAEPENRYRNKATFCNIRIDDMNQSPTEVQRISAIVDENHTFLCVFNYCSNNFYKITATFGAKFAGKPKINDLEKNMKNMQEQGILTDFAIKTQSDEFPCHKVVLAGRSMYFRTMFTTPMKETVENVLHWEDVFDATTVRDLLHYIYDASVPPNIGQTCVTLLEASHLCLLDDLKSMCENVVISRFTKENVLELLVVAENLESMVLKETAVNFIVDNFDEFNCDPVEVPGWSELEPAMCKRLLYSLLKIIGRKKVRV